jgi:hypothetical protein
MLQDRYGLTLTEANIARLFCNGMTLNQAAMARGGRSSKTALPICA